MINCVERPRSIAAFTVGDTASLRHTICQTDLDAFVALSGDRNRLHVDDLFARQRGFKASVVHGMLSTSFVSTLIGTLLPGDGALWNSLSVDFVAPVYVGDTIVVTGMIEAVSLSTQLVALQLQIENQRDETVLRGKALVGVTTPRSETAMSFAPPSTSIASVGRGDFATATQTKPRRSQHARVDVSEAPVVIVSGGSGGIGLAVCRRLLAAGYRVAVGYHSGKCRLDEFNSILAGNGIRHVLDIHCDVTQPESVTAAFSEVEARFGSPCAIVHCAAPAPKPRPFLDQDGSDYDRQFSVQVQGARHLVQRALPSMLQQQQGAFVFIGSIYAEGLPPIQQSPYIAAKAALHAFSRTIAAEFGPRGIRANVVAPGMTLTPMLDGIPEKAKMLTKMSTPLRQLAVPDDIAGVVAFLISPAARHVTGQTIDVSGGVSMH